MWMHADTALEVNGLSKLYSRSPATTRNRLAKTFAQALFGRSFHSTPKLDKGEFWSLKDINFSLKRGEALGIIGLNGAGKTTLLRILAGQMLPDEGEIRMLGKSAAIIDLTAGFQMSASGARNIYLRGAMLGRSKAEVTATHDEIVAFAELGDAIKAPLATYSSGMLMRLAFSIMVTTEPDILFIDEVLSVGDFRFRQKCLNKIRELRERTAFVFVSHSMKDIKAFCDRAILLDEGEVACEGEPDEVVKAYENLVQPPKLERHKKQANILEPQFHNRDAIKNIEHYWCDVDGRPITNIQSGDDLYLKAIFEIGYKPRNLILGIPVWTEEGIYVTGFSSETQAKRPEAIPGIVNEYLLKVPNLGFNPGIYVSNLGITDGPEFLYRGKNLLLTVVKKDGPHWGVVSMHHSIEKINC